MFRRGFAPFFRNPLVPVVAAYAGMVAIWGTTWLGIKFSLNGLPPVTGAGVRFIIAGLVLYALAFALRVNLRREAPPVHLVLVLATTMFGINYALTYLAETHLASGLVAVLFGTLPFFVFGFAHFMVGEKANVRMLGGAALAFGGVAVISLVGDVRGDFLYVVAALVAAASSGFANVYLKKFSHADPFATLAPAMLVAGGGLTASGLAFEHTNLQHAFAPGTIAAVLYLAVLGSAVAFYLNHWVLHRIDSGIVGLSALMIPVLAVIVGSVVGHEAFGIRDLLGAALVLGGMWLSLGRTKPRPSRVRYSHVEDAAVLG